jgi:hypothetical protein
MPSVLVKRKPVSKIVLQSGHPGGAAAFLVEAPGREERRRARQIFAAVAKETQVRQLSDGVMMAWAMEMRCDPTLFGRVRRALRDQFEFCIAEPDFTVETYCLIESLCQDTGSRLLKAPRCGICSRVDPFPTRVQMRNDGGETVLEAHYCSRCTARENDRSEKKFVRELLAADKRGFAELSAARLVRSPARRRPVDPASGADDIAEFAVAV